MKTKTPKIHGFFCIKDKESNLYLTCTNIVIGMLTEFGPDIAIYRSNKDAERVVRIADRQFIQMRNFYLKQNKKPTKYVQREILRPYSGLTVIELDVHPKGSLLYWDVEEK